MASLCAQKADCTERWLRFTSREVAHYYFAPNIIATQPGWQITLNSSTIEDIVINAHDQIDEPTLAQLFDAFVFYVENDAFILF
ncbi:DUF7716 domain-containing protein [Burkholderia cepacia]|uniref:DUF7716 domain-containing protein n=1 Tax=Burkholderia cepacia TaxID=292 RepID=UPI00215750AE|nr:hypothetical protein [Burkholderia cepacia]